MTLALVRWSILSCCLGTVLAGCSHGPEPSSVEATPVSLSSEAQTTYGEGRLEVISPVYNIDRIYKSMTGPWSYERVHLLDTETPELVWITGCHVEMVSADGRDRMPEQFMCHANLDFDADWHADLFRLKKALDGRLFTLSQGQLHVQFPPGFGIPVMSHEVLDLSTQVLNLNVKDRSFQVRHKVHVDFVRDRDAKVPMKPLYESGVAGMVSLEGRELVYDMQDATGEHEHQTGACRSCCVPGTKAVEEYELADSLGRRFTTHWVVKPGRETNRTRATTMLGLSCDTTIHYIAVHMHPFAESLELRDVTADKSIFKSNVRNLTGEIGLARVDSFSSEAGVPVFKDHEYELVSEYNNTTADDQDSMAVMYIYLLDKEYQGPDVTLQHLAVENDPSLDVDILDDPPTDTSPAESAAKPN